MLSRSGLSRGVYDGMAPQQLKRGEKTRNGTKAGQYNPDTFRFFVLVTYRQNRYNPVRNVFVSTLYKILF